MTWTLLLLAFAVALGLSGGRGGRRRVHLLGMVATAGVLAVVYVGLGSPP